MGMVVGIFTSRPAAERAASGLGAVGIPQDRISLLAPGQDLDPEQIPTSEGEGRGVGGVLGGVVGGAAGAAGGMQIGTVVSLAVPGIGPVVALGVLGAALLGVGGAAVGSALDDTAHEGLPRDEVYVYEDALRRGRSVVLAIAEDDAQADLARRVLDTEGAESVDAAREQWWVGLRDAESASYEGGRERFSVDEGDYRSGFEAACTVGRGGRHWDEVADDLERRYPGACRTEAFRRGWERGQRHDEAARRIPRAA
jgi:hypothetical protein